MYQGESNFNYIGVRIRMFRHPFVSVLSFSLLMAGLCLWNSQDDVTAKPLKLDAFKLAQVPIPSSENGFQSLYQSESSTSTPALKKAVFTVPKTVKQGEAEKVIIDSAPGAFDDGAIWMRGQKVPIFPSASGHYEAFLPVGIFQKSGGYTLKIQDKMGTTQFEGKVEVLSVNYPIQNISVSKSTAGLQPLPGEMEAIGALKSRTTPVRYWSEPFITPTSDCQNSPFGVKRYHNGKPTDNYHKGVDLRSPQGRPIRATTDGKVAIAKMYRLHGGTVGLDHGQGVNSIYIHMSKIAVTEGQLVKKGDIIGYVGSTGFATGPHLHWGLYMHGEVVNPNKFVHGVPKC